MDRRYHNRGYTCRRRFDELFGIKNNKKKKKLHDLHAYTQYRITQRNTYETRFNTQSDFRFSFMYVRNGLTSYRTLRVLLIILKRRYPTRFSDIIVNTHSSGRFGLYRGNT